MGYPFLLTGLGSYLIVEMPLEKADAIVILGGGAPFRAMEAARLYHSGYALRIVLTQARQLEEYDAFEKLGIAPPTEEKSYNQKVLLRLGIPSHAVLVLDGRSDNTKDELAEVGRWLKAQHGYRVLLVTSKIHTRRVNKLWESVRGDGLHGIVVYSRDDPFDPKKAWWKDRQYAGRVLHEYLGLVNYWLGFRI
jgi:uncharacterized SAM-binding protein YcdF (DUF218 family)